MKLFKKIPFTFEEKGYEIRVLYDNATINVVAFLNNHPANGYRHQVKLPKQCGVEEILERGAATELVEICKNNIVEKRWGTLSKMIRENVANIR